MTIGGILIERISGIKYHQYIEKNIFNILDMSNSSFSMKDKNEDNIAVGYTNLIDKKRKKHLFTNLVGKIDQPGAGAMSTINDLSKFVKWHFRVLDDNDNLKVAAMTYRAAGVDFFPGPLNADINSPDYGTVSSEICNEYNTHWSVKLSDVEAFIEYTTPIRAPVEKGDKLGSLSVFVDEKLIKKVDIFSNEKIKRTNIFSRLLKSFNFLVWGDA